jgi:peptidoglycan hydrolase-like protein with peptidoglycan-binding domain
MAFRSAIYISIIAIAAGLIYNRGFAASPTFERDLYYGLRGDAEVTRLQEFLRDEGVYEGPVTGNFFTLTLAGVKKFQTLQGIVPVSGYFGPKTRAAANSRLAAKAPAPDLNAQIEALLSQIKELERQLVLAKEREAVPPPPPPPPVPTGPFSSSLKMAVVLGSYSSSRYTNIPMHEIRLSADPGEDTAITRIKFTNNGTLADANFTEIKVTRANDGLILARLKYEDMLAMVANFKNKQIEIVFTPNYSLPDKGLMRSGNTYSIVGSIITPNTTLKPTIQLDIDSVSDIDARDYNDLTRVADISKMNVFPFTGPKITIN